MKEQILKLRKEGKNYDEIVNIVGCSKSTVSYHCGEGQKEKSRSRQRKRRKSVIIRKIKAFKERIRKFNKRNNSSFKRVDKNIELNFTSKELLDKLGEYPVCYLSGIAIDLKEDTYSFDHILPVSKGGDNSLENLGLTLSHINQMKSDLTVEELLYWCKIILKNNGYKVIK